MRIRSVVFFLPVFSTIISMEITVGDSAMNNFHLVKLIRIDLTVCAMNLSENSRSFST